MIEKSICAETRSQFLGPSIIPPSGTSEAPSQSILAQSISPVARFLNLTLKRMPLPCFNHSLARPGVEARV